MINDFCPNCVSGAVRILRKADDIDFKLLYSGKLCLDELQRIKRIRRASVKLPHFLVNAALYKQALKEMLYVNGLQPLVVMHTFYRKATPQKNAAWNTSRNRKKSSSMCSPVQTKKDHKYLYRDKSHRFSGYVNHEMFSIQQLWPKLVC